MAVTEFLEAVDKKKKAEQAAMAAAPVSAEVAPAAPSMFGTPAPMESVVDTVGQVEVQSPFSQAAAPNPMAAAVDTIAQPDLSAAAPAVQAPPSLVTDNPFAPSVGVSEPTVPQDVQDATERARIEDRLARTNADIVASGETVGGAPQEGFVSRLAGRLGEQFTQPAPYTPLPGGAESETAFGATPTQPTLFREGLSAISELNKTPLTRPDSYRSKAPEATPAVEAETPAPVADLSVNGTDVVTPEAIAEAGQVAQAAVAPQTPTAGSGGMITRDSTGESFIGGSQVAATPEEVSAYNATSGERMAAANTDAAAAERMRYNAPTINAQAERAAAVQAERDQPRAPVRATEQERRREEARSEKTFRKEAAKDIRAKVREFGRTNSMAKTREFERGLNEKLESDVIENRDYNRATSEANFANETAAYNRNTLTAAQRATDDGVSIRDQIALREEARGVEAKQLEETQSYNNASAAARSLIRDVGNIEDVAGTAKVQADSALTTGPGGLVMSILPGSKASDLRASLDTLTADSAFSALSEMRASSKTGGALGAISERELTLLGAAKRSLSANQSDEQLIKNIDTYVKIRNRMMADAKLRFAQDYGVERANEAFGGGQGGASSAIPNDRNVSGDAATEANIAKYNV